VRSSIAEKPAAAQMAGELPEIVPFPYGNDSQADPTEQQAQPSQAARDLAKARRWRDAYRAERERAKAAGARHRGCR
jgi:hypothetical protein